jgi:phospho-N-acetylmuramoyl-pentapeptide-transferase
MASTLAFGAIGFADDYIKVVHRRNLGLTGRAKLGGQFLVSAAIAVALIVMQAYGIYSTQLTVPFIKRFHPHLAVPFLTRIPHWGLVAFLPFISPSDAPSSRQGRSPFSPTSAGTWSSPITLNSPGCRWWVR